MSVEPTVLTGGESVYCINRAQLEKAHAMVGEDSAVRDKIEGILSDLQQRFDRNERAALAFVLIDRLLRNDS